MVGGGKLGVVPRRNAGNGKGNGGGGLVSSIEGLIEDSKPGAVLEGNADNGKDNDNGDLIGPTEGTNVGNGVSNQIETE